ncbi:MAG: hypothetical protein ACYDD2_04450 [Candidatus Acidiferrales bacterium]
MASEQMPTDATVAPLLRHGSLSVSVEQTESLSVLWPMTGPLVAAGKHSRRIRLGDMVVAVL